MRKYFTFTGTVTKFNSVFISNWTGSTWAASEKQALNNLKYQIRKSYGLMPSANIQLNGDLIQM